jgi:hypothetical protein
MDRYIPFCLAADFNLRWAAAETATKAALGATAVAPRILNNLVTLTFGLTLFQDFAKQWGVDLSGQMDLAVALANQVEEITGSGHGQVKLAADHFLEQLARMVEKGFAEREVDFTFTKLTTSIPGKQISPAKKYLAIHLKGAMQTFFSNAGRIGYVGEILDEDACMKQLKSRDYVLKVDHQKHFKPFGAPKKGINRKCVIIDLEAAEKAGLDVGGFYSIVQSCNNDDSEDDEAGQAEKKSEPAEKLTEELPF